MMDDGRRGYETWSEGRADWRPETEGGNPDDGRWTTEDRQHAAWLGTRNLKLAAYSRLYTISPRTMVR
jgi:hypothetical protein